MSIIVYYLVSVDKQAVPDFRRSLPEREWPDGYNGVIGIFFTPEELAKREEEISKKGEHLELRPIIAEWEESDSEAMAFPKSLGGVSWRENSMATARRALREGKVVVCFSLTGLFYRTEPDQVERIVTLCTEIDGECA